MTDLIPIRRALVSVSDKSGLLPLAQKLSALGVTIISTGGTARALREAGLAVTPIEEVTGFPEMMDGRVKTLHPKVHGGLLALRDQPEHVSAMQAHDIVAIDLVCVNLYPFEATVAKPNVSEHEAIENIDIGGPSMIRSAAKNHPFVAVLTDPGQYEKLLTELDKHQGSTTLALRKELAAAAFARTASYDAAIAGYMQREVRFPETMTMSFRRQPMELRYGENPHQQGAVYAGGTGGSCHEGSILHARHLHGIGLSYCNLFDADGALELVKEVDATRHAAAAVIKHANPCGFAVAEDLPTAFERAYEGDPVAAFGGIIALNRKVDVSTAERITAVKHKLDVILAPAYEPAALQLLMDRWKNTRLLEVGALPHPEHRSSALALKQITGGLLVQDRDMASFDSASWKHAGGPVPTSAMLLDMQTAMMAVKHLKSNAVCLVRGGMLVGGGAGQMDRLACCRIAVSKAGDRSQGAVAASDAFFPFRDGPDILIHAGVKGIVQPGGSVKDADTIQACNEAGVTLMMTGRRHFKH